MKQGNVNLSEVDPKADELLNKVMLICHKHILKLMNY
jgi:hypothetical protein